MACRLSGCAKAVICGYVKPICQGGVIAVGSTSRDVTLNEEVALVWACIACRSSSGCSDTAASKGRSASSAGSSAVVRVNRPPELRARLVAWRWRDSCTYCQEWEEHVNGTRGSNRLGYTLLAHLLARCSWPETFSQPSLHTALTNPMRPTQLQAPTYNQ